MPAQRFEEALTDGYYYGIEARPVAALRSEFQHIEILHHPHLGHVLRIDGALQCSESDEAAYHEPLVHLLMLHAAPRARLLIVGGGDGGAAEEALKWPPQRLQSVDQVELDAAVVQLCRTHLRSLHGGLLEPDQTQDTRYRLRIGDGLQALAQLELRSAQVDAVLLDLTDPGGPSSPLWTAAFFARCAQVLGPRGVLGLHIGCPWAQPARCQTMLDHLRQHFASVTPLVTTVPCYGGPWMLAIASGPDAPSLPSRADMDAQLGQLQGAALQVVDGTVLHAMVGLAHRW
jgi:spermidine synthase